MSGGLMQLVAYGAQDVYLTGSPQITFFKIVYRRHTNFSIEPIPITFQSQPGYGKRSTVLVSRNGDLVTQMYLRVVLNEYIPSSPDCKFAYVRRLGYSMIDYVEVTVGGSRIDRQYGIWLNIWYELARHAGDGERGFLKMIGDVPELTTYDNLPKPAYVMFVPLKFWFNRHCGLALPLIALQYHEVKLDFVFRPLEQLIVSNACFRQLDLNKIKDINAEMIINYVYCDSDERRKMAQVGHEYLIEQVQFTNIENVETQSKKIKLDFNHPSKELIWAIINGNYNSGEVFPFYYGGDDWNNVLDDAATKIILDSITLIDCDCDSSSSSCSSSSSSSSSCDSYPTCGEWELFKPNENGLTKNGKIYVDNKSKDKSLLINTNSLIVKNSKYSLTDKIYCEIFVDENNNVQCSNVKTSLTVRDLSFPLGCLIDTRFNKDDDATVYQWHNYGVLIDGTGNPVLAAKIQLNGHDRFYEREGSYFNYVVPDECHTNTPADGINVYSFALMPEQHQPSGTCNFSRIDNTQLILAIGDPTQIGSYPPLNYVKGCNGNSASNNQLYVYDINYNVFRVMSGMGGVAYAS